MSFDFKSIALGEVDISRPAGNYLGVGRHIVKVTDAKIEPKNGNYSAVMQFECVDTGNQIRDYILIHHTNPKAVEIGKQKLKQIAVYGGHVDPDNAPSHGIGSFKGLVVGISVQEDDYNGKKTNKIKFYFDPKEMGHDSKEFDDDALPF